MAHAFRITETGEDKFTVSREEGQAPAEGEEYTVAQEGGGYLVRRREDVGMLPDSIALAAYNATHSKPITRFGNRTARIDHVWDALMALSGPNKEGGNGHMTTKVKTKERSARKAKAAATPKAKKTAKAVNGERKPREFKEIEPIGNKDKIKAARAGSKVATLIDLLDQENGTTLKEIETKLSKTGRPVNARSWLGHSLRVVHGYGVKAKQVNGEERLFLACPEGMRKPLPHKSAEEEK
jgi:hypothetical protein